MRKLNNQGAAFAGLIIIVLGVFLVASLGFGLWAFAGRSDYKKNADRKAAQAVAAAEEALSAKKEAEFAEREKSPLKTYTSPSAQGSVSFTFPKTWSALVTESIKPNDSMPLDGYFHPNYLPGVKDNAVSYALRLELLAKGYDEVIKPFNSKAESGDARVTAFTPEKVPGSLGVKIDGSLDSDKTGVMVIIPLRDKTLRLWTESNEFANDFNTSILPSLTFVP